MFLPFKKCYWLYLFFWSLWSSLSYSITEQTEYLDCIQSKQKEYQTEAKICRRMFFYRSNKPILEPTKILEKDWSITHHIDDRARTTLPYVMAKVELTNFSDHNAAIVFYLGNMSTAKAELLLPDKKELLGFKKLSATGYAIPREERPLSPYNFLLPLKDIPPNSKVIVYIYINTAYGNRSAEVEMLPFEEGSLVSIEARDIPRHLAFGGFIVLAIYHLFVFFTLKDILYLRYVLLILFTYIFLILQQSGYLSRYFFHNYGWLLNDQYPILSFFGLNSAVSFLRHFVRGHHNIWLSNLSTLCVYIFGIDFIFLHWNIVDHFGDGGTIFTKINNLSIFISLILILVCVFQASKVYRPAKFLLYAFILPVGIAAVLLFDKVVTQFFSQRVFVDAMLWSVLGEGILFSFALSDRFAFLRRQISKLTSEKMISDEKAKHMGRIESLLENVEHGIILLGEKAVIETASKYTEKILEKNQKELIGENLHQILISHTDLNKDTVDLLFVAFDTIYQENELAWYVNNHLFPQKMRFKTAEKTKILEAHWSVIVAEDVITDVVLAVTDRTDAEKHEQALKEKDEQTARLAIVMSHLANQKIELFARIISDVFLDSHECLAKIEKVFQKDTSSAENQKNVLVDAMRTYHTIKGLMRTYLASDCANLAHHIEDELSHAENNQTVFIQELKRRVEALHHALQAYQIIFSKLNLSLEKNKAHFSDAQSPFEAFLATEFFQIQQALQRVGIELLDFKVVDEIKSWPEKSLKIILQILPMATANMIDHGYLLPKSAGRPRKRYGARLAFIAKKYQDKIRVELIDDGYGIDLNQLQELASKKSVDISTLKDPTEILFFDGVSTAYKVSEKTGRGVGLSAIRAMARSVGGEASISGSTEHGAVLTILI